MPRLAVVIPARMASTRFPGKPLVDLAGKPMIQWVWEAAMASGVSETVVVAAPDEEILSASRSFGAQTILTRSDHASGTDRLAEVAGTIVAAAYLNVQGDEPLIALENLRRCAGAVEGVEMASVFVEAAPEEIDDPAVVKVATDLDGYALYFSRYAIPYPRNGRPDPVKKHVGLYAYTRDALLNFTTWPASGLEVAEGLEQLRFLEHGVRIRMVEGVPGGIGVDTPEHAALAREALRKAFG